MEGGCVRLGFSIYELLVHLDFMEYFICYLAPMMNLYVVLRLREWTASPVLGSNQGFDISYHYEAKIHVN